MSKRSAVIIGGFFLSFSFNIYTQQVTTEWVINNFNGYPVGVMVGADKYDNIFVTGHAGDFTKIITTKYDKNGTVLWERFYSVPDLGTAATWLSVDSSENVIVTGYTRTFSSNPVESGLLTIKYDNNGNLLWDKLIPGTWAFTVRSIIDPSDNIYVTGRAWQYSSTYDFVTVKYAPDGTQIWFDTFDQNGGFHTPTGMELDQNGNLFITGSGLSGGLITVMYSNDGTREWVREEPGTAGQNIRVDGKGGIFITGSYYDVNTGTGNDFRLLKYDYNGNLVWQKFYDFGNSEFGRLLNIDSQSNIFITGFGILPGQLAGWLTSKFDSSGNLLWSNRYKENQYWEEYPYFTLTGPEDEIYITGNAGVTLGGTTYNGLATIRYNADGSNAWTAEINQYAGIGKGLTLDTDLSLYAAGMYYYSVIKYSQTFPTGSEKVPYSVPEAFLLGQNYPNPFNPVTTINYSLSSPQTVNLRVFDILGNEIFVVVNEEKAAGSYKVNFDAGNLTSGVYFYQMRAGNIVETRKMILLR
jgi:hypothetical protein